MRLRQLTQEEKNKVANLVDLLSGDELEFTAKSIANTAFISAGMTRLCLKGSNKRFQYFAWQQVRKLGSVTTCNAPLEIKPLLRE